MKYCLLAICLIFFCASTSAHVIVEELENMSVTDTCFFYMQIGFQHIIPDGFDHILFVLSLFLINPKLKTIIRQSAAFTLAHSVTLALSMYNVITPDAFIIEPLISLSIVFVALQNIFSSSVKPSRILIVFLFGLVHGLGFASSLSSLELPRQSFFTSLLMFNVGVELGQLAVILAGFLLLEWFRDSANYRKLIVVPVSVLIAIVASWWTIERIAGSF